MTKQEEAERRHCESVALEVHDEEMAHAMGAKEYRSPHDMRVAIIARERADARRQALEEACLAKCAKCRMGMRLMDGWHHNLRADGPDTPCPSEAIRALASPKP